MPESQFWGVLRGDVSQGFQRFFGVLGFQGFLGFIFGAWCLEIEGVSH